MQELQKQPGVLRHRSGDIEQRDDGRRLVDPSQAVEILGDLRWQSASSRAACAADQASLRAHPAPQRRVRSSACGNFICAIARVTSADLLRAHLREVLGLQKPRDQIPRVERSFSSISWDPTFLLCANASCTRRDAGGGGFRAFGRQRHRVEHAVRALRAAKEQIERLREDQRMLVTFGENQIPAGGGGEQVGAVANVDQLHRVQRIDHHTWTDRQSGYAQTPARSR